MCAEKRAGADDPWGKSKIAAVSVMCGAYIPPLST